MERKSSIVRRSESDGVHPCGVESGELRSTWTEWKGRKCDVRSFRSRVGTAASASFFLFLPRLLLHHTLVFSPAFLLPRRPFLNCFPTLSHSRFVPPSLCIMSDFGKEPDPSKRGGAGGAQKDCDACGNRDHVQKATTGDNWDKTKTDLSGAAQAANDRLGDDKHGGGTGVLGP